MTPQQLSELLVGISRAQATILTAVEKTLDKISTHQLRQVAQQLNNVALTQGAEKKKITFETLPNKLLEAALAPGSMAGREISATALTEVTRLLANKA